MKTTAPLISRICFLASLRIFAAPVILMLHPMDVGAQDTTGKTYPPAVVEKAEKILEDAGLRQSGKVIQSTETSDIARAISGLTKARRELRLVYLDWKQIEDRIAAIKSERNRLIIQNGEMNLQLARNAGGDVTSHNRLVGLINANVAMSKVLDAESDRRKAEVAEKRAALNSAEAEYAETVLAIRADYKELRSRLESKLLGQPVQIALRVMHANFETPEGLTADKILASVDKRLQRIEQEVFSESIKLDVENNSLYVDVVVGRKSTRMVVDSGANMISLPSKTATELGIEIPADAPTLRMILADGREIPARGVVLARVRVGEFEAENVEAAVLDAAATDAEPLLGMSYLGNFKFEIDMADRSLKMLRVKTD